MNRPSSRTRVLLLAALQVSLLVFLQFFRPPGDSLLWFSFLDAGHVPLFGMFALVTLALLSDHRDRPLLRYVLAFAITAAVSLLVEVLQYYGPRDADPVDWARGLAGALVFLSLVLVFDRNALRSVPGPRGLVQGLLVVAAVGILAASLASFARLGAACVNRTRAFPRICDFQSGWETEFYDVHGAELARVPPPPGWERVDAGRVGRLTFLSGTYPGFHLTEPIADWRGYDRLCLDVYSENRVSRDLELVIHDRKHDNAYTDRFNRSLSIRPGANAVCIPLSEIRTAPKSREMDMRYIHGLSLFAVRPDTVFTVYLDAIRLEGTAAASAP